VGFGASYQTKVRHQENFQPKVLKHFVFWMSGVCYNACARGNLPPAVFDNQRNMEKLDLTRLNMSAFIDEVLPPDGHGLFGPERYDEVGFPEGFLPVHTHESGDCHKSSIFVDGERVESVEAVYHLELLWDICDSLDLKPQTYMGRGSQARELSDVIFKHCEELGLLGLDENKRIVPKK
jgi:hypothetical protein